MRNVDLLIIGGGSAGMAAAIQAKKEGIDDILIVDKEDHLGGVLNQCIHNGFGLTEFNEELTGPEYMYRFSKQIEDLGIKYMLNTEVNDLNRALIAKCASKDEGLFDIQAKAIVFAVGCFERSPGHIMLPGDRCAGILTAGQAQKYMNIHGYMVGKRVVILGSGDIGLIMARRLTLEGAKVVCVSELMPYSAGLARNIQQCLVDFDIPLYLSRSVSKVIGKDRVEKVVLSAVNERRQFVPGTEMEIECDTLILSVGLVPYISLLRYMGCDCSMGTSSAIVDEKMQSNIPGLFVCGNCLHVHDVVDFVSDEGRLAGHGAAEFIHGQKERQKFINIVEGNNVRYVVPQHINIEVNEDITFKFRCKTPLKDQNLIIRSGDKVVLKLFKMALVPSEMVMVKIPKENLKNLTEDIVVELEDK